MRMIPNLLICVVTETPTDDFDLPIRRTLCVEILRRGTALFIAYVLYFSLTGIFYRNALGRTLNVQSSIDVPKKASTRRSIHKS